jgi:hypothetical protein
MQSEVFSLIGDKREPMSGIGIRRDAEFNPRDAGATHSYSRTVACNCALNASTIFVCAAFASASVSVLSAAR